MGFTSDILTGRRELQLSDETFIVSELMRLEAELRVIDRRLARHHPEGKRWSTNKTRVQQNIVRAQEALAEIGALKVERHLATGVTIDELGRVWYTLCMKKVDLLGSIDEVETVLLIKMWGETGQGGQGAT